MRRNPFRNRIILLLALMGPILVFGVLLAYTVTLGQRVDVTITACEWERSGKSGGHYECSGTWTVDGERTTDDLRGWFAREPEVGSTVEARLGPMGAYVSSALDVAIDLAVPVIAAAVLADATRRMLRQRRVSADAAKELLIRSDPGDVVARCEPKSITGMDGTRLFTLSGNKKLVRVRREADGAEWSLRARMLGDRHREVTLTDASGAVVGRIRSTVTERLVSVADGGGNDHGPGVIERQGRVWHARVIELGGDRVLAEGVRVGAGHVMRVPAATDRTAALLYLIFPIVAAWVRRSMLDLQGADPKPETGPGAGPDTKPDAQT
ncbi:hypothetical protein [Stackebrandtia soli]|uniref:hypothetical protein n=1 Tax=Stackebrandtia soli TaxID=1892856 RepID=UPI0039EAE51E